MRLFYAFLLPEEMRDALCALMDRMRPCFRSGVFTRRENLHLTLAFLGEMGPEQTWAARDALKALHAEPFPLRFGSAGRFRRNGGDVYWVGVERNAALEELHGRLDRELRARGLPVEDRPFRPHLTLVRQGVPTDGFDGQSDVPAMSMRADRVSLMESGRVGGRLVYTEREFQMLKGGESI